MIKIWNWIRNNPNRAMFLVPIILVAGISISHVVTWYDIANPINWAIYLSIAIEIGAMTALVAATNRIKGGVWFMFGIVTFIQMIGNIFYCYKEIDETGELFKSWVELTSPVWELMGTYEDDVIGLKRWLAFLEGGLLPVISLTSLHFFVKYDRRDIEESTSVKNTQVEEEVKSSEVIVEPEIEVNDVDDNITTLVSEEDVDHSLIEEVIPEEELPKVSPKKVKKPNEGIDEPKEKPNNRLGE